MNTQILVLRRRLRGVSGTCYPKFTFITERIDQLMKEERDADRLDTSLHRIPRPRKVHRRGAVLACRMF